MAHGPWNYGDTVYTITWKTGGPTIQRHIVIREDERYGIELSDDTLHPSYWRPQEIFRTRAEAETQLNKVR